MQIDIVLKVGHLGRIPQMATIIYPVSLFHLAYYHKVYFELEIIQSGRKNAFCLKVGV